MKVKAHIRVARQKNGRAKLAANAKPSNVPLLDGRGYELPTVCFAVVFDVPDAMFKTAEQVIATLTIPEDQARIAAEVSGLAVEEGRARG